MYDCSACCECCECDDRSPQERFYNIRNTIHALQQELDLFGTIAHDIDEMMQKILYPCGKEEEEEEEAVDEEEDIYYYLETEDGTELDEGELFGTEENEMPLDGGTQPAAGEAPADAAGAAEGAPPAAEGAAAPVEGAAAPAEGAAAPAEGAAEGQAEQPPA